jgi:DNA polymerase elongation subunit (family B)
MALTLTEVLSRARAFREKHGRLPNRREVIDHRIATGHFMRWNTKWSDIVKMLDGPPRDDATIIEPQGTAYKPKILLLDIETAPIEARVWGLWDQNVGTNQITRDWFVMSYCAKFHGEDKVYYLDQRYSSPIEDDFMLLTAIHHLMSEADVVVGHNLDKFDMKKLNTRFFKHGLPSVGYVRQFDTLKVCKRHFAITSNKLDYVARFLGLEGKLEGRMFPGQELWNQCLAGNLEAWNEMERYNKQDVSVLEAVFERLLHWDRSLNFAAYQEENVCSCGSKDLRPHTYRTTNAGKYLVVKCAACGKEYQRRENLLHKDTRAVLIRP